MDWIYPAAGCHRRERKILLQENVETVTFQSLADLAEKAPEAAYIIPFLNVYAALTQTIILL